MLAHYRFFSSTPVWIRFNILSGLQTLCSSFVPCIREDLCRSGLWSSLTGTARLMKGQQDWCLHAGAQMVVTFSTQQSFIIVVDLTPRTPSPIWNFFVSPSTYPEKSLISDCLNWTMLRITLWSLSAKSVSYIKYPKACQRGIAFTNDGRHMALAERRDCKDYISIFVCNDWRLLRHFETETHDLTGIDWAPNGCVLAVWDTCLEYKVLFYSLDGRLLSTYCAYEWSLGIKSVAWSPSSQFLAIGSFDEKVRILNHVTWKPIKQLEHPATVTNPKTVVYKEVEKFPCVGTDELSFPASRGNSSSLFSSHSKYEIAQVPVSLRTIKPDPDRANPELGIGLLAFSPDNRYLASKNDNMPHSIWIWDIQKMRLFVVLEQTAMVRSFQWDPIQPRLAICTGNSRVYLWSPTGCVSVQVPVEGIFNVLSMSWHPLGEDALLLMSKDHLCLCYLETEEDNEKGLLTET
ncbi:WD repeat-containing protein WRAP73 isoform X2 [Ascaphus truei]|uniref:WD repeat-containing protein WRAP73 isoform X2 n=1 Tax=Ascaphus truei TaxID=8439 RepID=UPI003F5A5772